MLKRVKKVLLGIAALAALAAGGSAIAGAATSGTTTTTTTVAQTPPASDSFPPHGSAAHEDAEKAVTGDAASKARAAAVASIGSGTAGAVTTDYTGTGYEVTVTKSDGSTVEVHLDSSFAVMQAPGPGGPGH